MTLVAQIESLCKKIDGMMAPRVAPVMLCETYSGGLPTNDYPNMSTFSR